jgi:hypothetical protein
MQTTAPAPQDQPLNLLADWISREQLAGELGIACDTLGRWEARQIGPPCTRIGRKVLYRRTSVESWINAQEQTRATRTRRGRK